MSSYFNRRTIGSSDPSHRPIPTGYPDIRVPSQQRGMGQQNQHQFYQPSVTPQGFMGYGHDSIPPPPRHTYDNPSFQCNRCGSYFSSQADLDGHSLACGAVALLTGMFMPWPAQQNDQYHQPQPHPQARRGEGGYNQAKYPIQDQTRRA